MVNESEENVTQGERSKEEVLWSSVKANASEKELPILSCGCLALLRQNEHKEHLQSKIIANVIVFIKLYSIYC